MIPFLYDPTYILIIPALILSLYAQWKVSSTFNKFKQVRSSRGISGAKVAEQLLKQEGVVDVPVEMTEGILADHYDPIKKVLKLSPDVFNSDSVASVSVAAHEAGHAIQHARGYWPLILRTGFYPVANFGSKLAFILILIGFFVSAPYLLKLGIIFFSASVFFTIITLPVEFDASSRALAMIHRSGIVTTDELKGAKKVLNAAALTYVAAALVAVLELLRLIIMARSRD